jgi:acyl-CoA reductase-like NAD-dependent aldehyde dehydrogenase
MSDTTELESLITRLAAGAAAGGLRDAATGADLALRTARSVAAAAEAWTDAAVALKQADGAVQAAALAEETATGPLATLRLLLITARALADIGRSGLPSLAVPPRVAHAAGGSASRIEVDVLPVRGLHDGTFFGGQRATVRCGNPGGLEAFERTWRREVAERPRSGGVALVLGAGNVTGLAPADCICQIFEHGRAVLLKLHPLHGPLRPILETALEPLVAAGLLAIVVGGAELARAALESPRIGHVHLTGGQAAFEALVWGGERHSGAGGDPVLAQSITCELGSVTPWIIVPGRYSRRELACQADMVAASIANNTSFNCIATKIVVTARSWEQRKEFLDLVDRRLRMLPARPAWYPGATAAWETLAEKSAPADGTLPWIFRRGIDTGRDPRWCAREWFVPAAAEIPIEASDIEAFCTGATDLTHRLPGTLAASVTAPAFAEERSRQRFELLCEHLGYGVVAVNCWSALAYAMGNVPWGGYPGATLEQPQSGIGRVHDPLLLPLVHNTIVRGPLAIWPKPPWFPWHNHGAALARGVVGMYADIARGRSGLTRLARMLPAVLTG